MYEPSMTLPERERLHYITNSPVHRAVVGLLDAENDALDEMRHERDMAKEERDRFESQNADLENDLEKAEEKLKDLREQIEAAGVDLA